MICTILSDSGWNRTSVEVVVVHAGSAFISDSWRYGGYVAVAGGHDSVLCRFCETTRLKTLTALH
jgi:hypothetical protein